MEHEARCKATFIVQVEFCQNASWQGKIAWTDQKKEQNFRSALELLKLMDEALQGERSQRSQSNWD